MAKDSHLIQFLLTIGYTALGMIIFGIGFPS